MRKLFNIPNLATLCLVVAATSARAQAPVVSTDPAADTVCENSIATFSIEATGATSFYWQEWDGTAWTTLADGGLYSGATNDTLNVSAASTLNGRSYRAIAVNTSGEDTSANAMLTINALPNAGTITGINNICVGASLTLNASAGGGTWSSSNTALATVNSVGQVFTVGAGLDTIHYTVTTPSCGSDVASYTIQIDDHVSASPILGAAHVCVAGAITLTNAAGAGTWSASNGNVVVGSTTGLVSGVAAGIDTITYVFNNTCGTFTETTTVTVETPLPVGTISGPATVCVGSPATFVATEPGGIWISSDGAVASVDLPGLITGRGQGTAVIMYVVGNSCGSGTAMDTIQVDRQASVITGPDSVGVGAMITLADSAIGGAWTSVDITVATISTTGMVTGVATGTTNIEYTVTNFCGTSTAVKNIHVGVAPSAGIITGGDSLCVGAQLTLSASVVGGVWSASNTAASVDADGVVTGITGAMADTIHYTVSNGFGSSTVSKVVYVDQIPVITIDGPSSVSLNVGYTLVATPAGGTWVSTNTDKVIFISSNTFVAIKRGVVDLIYTVTNDCGTSSDTFVVNLPTTGVEEVAANNMISIAPNPNNGSFSINVAAAANEKVQVVITNMVGAVVSETTVDANKANNIALNQPAGVYFVTATTGSEKYTTKVVVTK